MYSRELVRQVRRHAGLPAIPVAITGKTGGVELIGGRCLLMGWSVDNTSAGNIPLLVYDGADASGMIVASPVVATISSNDQWFGDSGVLLNIGLFVNLGAGPWNGSFYVVPLRSDLLEWCD